jgi:hypothetical protein
MYETTNFQLFSLDYQFARDRRALPIFSVRLREACHPLCGDSISKNLSLETQNQQQALERFGEMVLADRALHDQLRATATETAFIQLAVRLAAERGCELTATALQAAINQKRQGWLERWL